MLRSRGLCETQEVTNLVNISDGKRFGCLKPWESLKQLQWDIRKVYAGELREARCEIYKTRVKTEMSSHRQPTPGVVLGDESLPTTIQGGHDEELLFC